MEKLSNAEIDSLEVKIGYRLPGLYRKLLVEIGAGEQGAVEIYHPLQIAELYKHHFDDHLLLFEAYFPFGCNNKRQEIWLVRVSDEQAASVWHETHSDDYLGENWLSYEDWLGAHEAILPA